MNDSTRDDDGSPDSNGAGGARNGKEAGIILAPDIAPSAPLAL
ncbi:hypothetical protein BURCENBC7_AP7305 [Burkholderia cenocepacia BC7]|nr:hypothetical protein BURCENBC7_AP7305 [Burkholderia cenocepacia BC7]